jgi:thioredoxin 1
MNPTAAAPAPRDWWVICLCAEWCGVCREWRELFEQLAAAHPDLQFAWVDVEIAQGDSPRFFGPVQPSPTQVSRLLASLMEGPVPVKEPAEAAALLQRLAPIVLSKS